MFIHQWKNKGILVPVYVVICILVPALTIGVVHRNFGGAFDKIPFSYVLVFALAVAGLWTYLTCEAYYIDVEGNKKVLDIKHQFYWIKMKYWAYILWVIAAVILVYSFLDSSTNAVVSS
jgi:hypothetical protein